MAVLLQIYFHDRGLKPLVILIGANFSVQEKCRSVMANTCSANASSVTELGHLYSFQVTILLPKYDIIFSTKLSKFVICNSAARATEI